MVSLGKWKVFTISQHSFCIYYNEHIRFVVYTLVCIDLDFPIVNEVSETAVECGLAVPRQDNGQL